MDNEREFEKTEEYAVTEVTEEAIPDEPVEDTPKAAEIQKGYKERFYDRIPLSAKQLNVIIILLMIALVVCLVLGALVGNGLI